MSSKTKASAAKEEATSALVPKLRFPEFRGAKGWHATPLGELGEIVTGKTPSTKEEDLWGGEILFITPTDITEGEKYQHTTQRTVVQTTGTKVLPSGSVVYTCIASIGKMSLTVVPSVTNQQINAVVPKGKTAREFLYYSLANLTPWIKSIPATSTLPIINKTQFSGFIIPHPEDKAEQQKIAGCLSSVDALIAAQARKVDALKTHKKGLMQQLFPTEGETQPRLRFPEFQNSGEWVGGKLISLCSEPLSNGVFNDPKKVGAGYKLINVSDMYIETTIDESRLSLIELSPSEFEGNQVITGDIFFTRSSLVKSGIAVSNIYLERSKDVTYDGHLIRFRANTSKVIPLFAHYLFKTFPIRAQLIARGKTATMTTIGQADVASVTLFYPDKAEQHRIVSCLSSLDALITAETQKLDALKTHKKGLMQQLFPSAEDVDA